MKETKQGGKSCRGVDRWIRAAWVGMVVIAFQGGSRAAQDNATKQPIKQLKIDLDKTVGIELPKTKRDLVPVAFKAGDEREGWVIRFPGNRPIATPAYADGRIFVGGGYGSHEFYAFDA